MLSILKILLLTIKFLKSIIKKNNIKQDTEINKGFNLFRLIENLNNSFEASDVIYINKISIPPIKIKNKEYENQNIKLKIPVNSAIKIVWVIKVNPIVKGWFMNKNKKLFIINKKKKKKLYNFQKIVYLKY